MLKSGGVRGLGAAPSAERALIVRHGAGCGRRVEFLDDFLRILSRDDPRAAARIAVHQTGAGRRPDMNGVSVVLFWLGDPLSRLYPDCYREAVEIAQAARALKARVLNAPEALDNTSKARQSVIWTEAGFPCARAVGFGGEDELLSRAGELRYPVILRSDHSHAQHSMFVCASRADLERRAASVEFPATALAFVDVREMWRRSQGPALFKALHHKKRAMVFGDRVVNNHVFFSENAIVGFDTSTFSRGASRVAKAARALGFDRLRLSETIDADIAYSLGPTEHGDVLATAVRALGLDVAAVDYSSLPDGGLVLWEANPYFNLQWFEDALWSKPRRLAERNVRYYRAAAGMLSDVRGREIEDDEREWVGGECAFGRRAA